MNCTHMGNSLWTHALLISISFLMQRKWVSSVYNVLDNHSGSRDIPYKAEGRNASVSVRYGSENMVKYSAQIN